MEAVLTYNRNIASEGTLLPSAYVETVALPDISFTDPEQVYFWTRTWQRWEREADEDLRAGRYADFDDVESLLKGLNKGSNED